MIFAPLSLLCLAASALASPSPLSETGLVKRDPSGIAATRAFQNCVVRDRNYHTKKHGGSAFCNQGIQMAECHINARVMNQVFAVFMPANVDPLEGEGGWYGECCAYNVYPDEGEIGEVANPNYACFTWETKDKVQGSGPPTLPKTKMNPFPVICPSNLDPCYSFDYLEDSGSRMARWESITPTFTGVWGSPKSTGKDGRNQWLWCKHICGGCKTGSWQQMQTDNIAELGCSFDECIPYQGNTQLLGQLTIEKVGTYPSLDSYDVCASYHNGTKGGSTGGSTSTGSQAPVQQGKGGNSNNSGSGTGKKNKDTGSKSGNGSSGNGTQGGSSVAKSGSGNGSNSGSENGKSQGSKGGSGSKKDGTHGQSGHVPNGKHGKGTTGHHNKERSQDCDQEPPHKKEKKTHKHKPKKHESDCPPKDQKSTEATKTTNEQAATKREDSLLPILRRHHIKQERRRNIF